MRFLNPSLVLALGLATSSSAQQQFVAHLYPSEAAFRSEKSGDSSRRSCRPSRIPGGASNGGSVNRSQLIGFVTASSGLCGSTQRGFSMGTAIIASLLLCACGLR